MLTEISSLFWLFSIVLPLSKLDFPSTKFSKSVCAICGSLDFDKMLPLTAVINSLNAKSKSDLSIAFVC